MTEKGNKRFSGTPLVVKDRVISTPTAASSRVLRTDHCGRANTGRVVWQFDTRLSGPLILAEPFDRRLQRPGGYPILCL
jgi:hypothetical protein